MSRQPSVKSDAVKPATGAAPLGSTVDRSAGSQTRRRRWSRIVITAVIVVIVVAYATYMSLGMPGMDHPSAVDPPSAGTVAAGAREWLEDAPATWSPDGSARPTGAAAAADRIDSAGTLRSGEWHP